MFAPSVVPPVPVIESMVLLPPIVNVPEFALANTKGEYVIEGYGVDPDIEVENDPKSVLGGHDPQLERAVGEIMKKIVNPVRLPKRPADPVKTGIK